MTKAKATPKYELKDFFTKTNNETSKRMDLLLDGEKTGHYLMVKGSQAPSIQRSIINAQVTYADIEEDSAKIKDKGDKQEFIESAREEATIKLALDLVDGWSFGEFSIEDLKSLLEENKGLALSVFSFAGTSSNYLQKK